MARKDMKTKIQEEIKAEMKNVNSCKKGILDSLKKVEVDWNWLSDFDSDCGNLHNSIVWILANKELLEEKE